MRALAKIQKLALIILGMMISVSAVQADDIEIYNNTELSNLNPPMTIIALDLNLLGICNPLLTEDLNVANPEAPQLCLDFSGDQTVEEMLDSITDDPNAFLATILGGKDATDLCVLNDALGLASPIVPLDLGLLGGLVNLTCGTLAGLLGNPLISGIVNAAIPDFVDDLVAGLVDPFLSTVIGELPTALVGVLATTINGVLSGNLLNLISFLESILNNLINSRVAVLVSHADMSANDGTPAASCSFGEQAAIPTSRRETTNCSNGGYFIVGFTSLVDQGTVDSLVTTVTGILNNIVDPTNLAAAITTVVNAGTTNPATLLPPFQAKENYAEILNYLAGDTIFNAPLDDFDGIIGLLGRDTNIESGSSYIQPASQCEQVNVLNIQVSPNTREDESDPELAGYLPGALVAGNVTLESVVTEADDPGFVDLSSNPIQLNSYFVLQENLGSVESLGNVGANLVTYSNALGLLNLGQDIADVLIPVLSVDASLITPTITALSTTPGSIRGETFFSLFRPDEDQKARWGGNLKKLALRRDDSEDGSGLFEFFDANDDLAIADDGRIAEDALTFWSTPANFAPDPGDGRDVFKGGAGEKIPGYLVTGGGDPGRNNSTGSRQMFFDRANATTLELVGINTNDATIQAELQASLTAADATEAEELLLYARGFEVGATTASFGTGPGIVGRSWMHGAVLHSRPVAVNYGARSGYSEENPDIRIVYGATDGLFRMVRNTSTGSAQSGVESWAFLPQAVMPEQKILRDNGVTTNIPYGVDGAPTVRLRDRDSSGGPADGVIDSSNTHDRAAVYFGLRRGGNHMYALDIKNPDSPSLLWRIGPDGLYQPSGLVAGSNTQFAEMALTFSSPQAGRMQIESGSPASTSFDSVIVFGGGYNGGRDSSNNRIGKDLARGSDDLIGTDDTTGNAIYIVDAESGELIWKATSGALDTSAPFNTTTKTFLHPLMVDSFAGDVTIVDTDGDALIDRLYALDTGGRLWRGDFSSADPSEWTIGPLVSVGRHDLSTVASDRRFFSAPDYVPTRDSVRDPFDAIVFGSGDRADPLNTTTENYLYVYRDRDTASGKAIGQIITTEAGLTDHSDFTDLTTSCASASSSSCAAPADSLVGWTIQFTEPGEKVFSQPVSIEGNVFFTTFSPFVPAARVCTPEEGSNRIYGVSLSDSRGVVQSFIDDNDGSDRSTDGGPGGIPGGINTLNSSDVLANTQTLETKITNHIDTYWRERRGADETSPDPEADED